MKFRLLLLLIFWSTYAFAQIENEKGILYLSNGKALEGNISYFFDKSADVIFQNAPSDKTLYALEQVKEIHLSNGTRFVSRLLQTNSTSKPLLLQTLIDSPMLSFYKGEDQGQWHYYITKEDTLYRLENNDKEIIQDDRSFKVKDRKYIGVLKYLMYDRKDIVNRLDKLYFSESEISKVILAYNKGDVSYLYQYDNRSTRQSNWLVFSQFSNYGSYYSEPLNFLSYGLYVGLQHFIDKSSRHSLKYSLDVSSYRYEGAKEKAVNIGLRYELICFRSQFYNFYFMTHIADLSYVLHTQNAHFMPRLSPGLGLELKPFSRYSIYAEMNHLLQLKEFPKSFSIGMKYDFGKITR